MGLDETSSRRVFKRQPVDNELSIGPRRASEGASKKQNSNQLSPANQSANQSNRMQAKWVLLILSVAAALALLGAPQAAASFMDHWSCADSSPGDCNNCCMTRDMRVHRDAYDEGSGCICEGDV